jgi:hypothetical protein
MAAQPLPPLDWRSLYQSAVLELDPIKLPTRVSEAHRAIAKLLETSLATLHPEETEELSDALNNLAALRRQYESRVPQYGQIRKPGQGCP